MNPAFERFHAILAKFESVREQRDELVARCCFPERHKNGDANPSLTLSVKNGNLLAWCRGCKAKGEEVASRIGVPIREWRISTMSEQPFVKPKKVAEYQYHKADGTLVAVKTRLEPGYNGQSKTFVWDRIVDDSEVRKLVRAEPKQKLWARSLKSGHYAIAAREEGRIVLELAEKGNRPTDVLVPGMDELMPIYRLHRLTAADPNKSIIVVEGEKDADNLVDLGFEATTGHAGKNCWFKSQGHEVFAGRKVIVCGDVDAEGVGSYDYSLMIAATCMKYEAFEVRVVDYRHMIGNQFPKDDGTPGKDITDFMNFHRRKGMDSQGIRKAVIALFAMAQPWRPHRAAA